MYKTFKFKLFPSKRNKKLIHQLWVAWRIRNYCVAIHNKHYKLFHTYLDPYRLRNFISKQRKKDKYAYMNGVMSTTRADVVFRLDIAYKSFFRNLKAKKKTSLPRFIKFKNFKSFTIGSPGNNFISGNKIRLNKVWYKVNNWRSLEGKAKRIIVSRDNLGDFYVSILCEIPEPLPANDVSSRPCVGLDFGLHQYLTSSDGVSDVISPEYLKDYMARVKDQWRRLSRKKNTRSKNYRREVKKLGRLHRKIRNKREYFQYKLAKRLVHSYKVICIETLDIKDMHQHPNWGRKISDIAFADFVRKLEYLAAVEGVTLIKVPKYFASSQTCSNCGERFPITKDLKVREWTCPNCGKVLDRDRNAANNILIKGLEILNS